MREDLKVVARIAPIKPMAHLREEKRPTSVLEYVVYRGVVVSSRWRKQSEINLLLKSIMWVCQHRFEHILYHVDEIWCDSNADCYSIKLFPPITHECYYMETLRLIGKLFSRALFELHGGHNGIYVKCGPSRYDVESLWAVDYLLDQPETE